MPTSIIRKAIIPNTINFIIERMSTKNGETLTYRVTQLEKQYCELDIKIDSILSNHLPHIQETLAEIKTRILMFTAINVGTMIIAILLHEVL